VHWQHPRQNAPRQTVQQIAGLKIFLVDARNANVCSKEKLRLGLNAPHRNVHQIARFKMVLMEDAQNACVRKEEKLQHHHLRK
jgi:hypothetical protein